MTSLCHHWEGGISLSLKAVIDKFKALYGKYAGVHLVNSASVSHGDFQYNLVPNTAIFDFHNTRPVTEIVAGDCYVCIFEGENYQGMHLMLSPGETCSQPEACGSLIVSMEPFSINQVKETAQAPEWCWAMSGPRYIMNFSGSYQYA